MPTNPMVSEYARSYNSFGGVDIKAVFGSKVIGELQAISFSITREKAPIYTMGSPDPRSFSRGKRGIAGTLVFIVFDRHALLHHMQGLKFFADKDEIRPADAVKTNPLSKTSLTAGTGSTRGAGSVASDGFTSSGESLGSDHESVSAWYVDQIPPFDITLSYANEYGATAALKIFGVELLNEGMGVSIDDIVSEQQMTYVARGIVTLTPGDFTDPNKV